METQQSANLPQLDSLWQDTLQWQPNDQQQALFERLYRGIVEGNRQFNLTRITAPQDFWEKHLWDSLAGIAPWLQEAEAKTIVDIGTGAGFPGLPVAIARPGDRVTLLDSTRKKIAFLDRLIAELDVTNVTTLATRAETLASRFPAVDVALIRAVGTASRCTAYVLPLLKSGGTAVLYRGQWSETEAAEVSATALQYGGVIESVKPLTLPLSHGMRHCVYLCKQ
jgi:16S rRNA (guanine527-N7)-methyltransferase